MNDAKFARQLIAKLPELEAAKVIDANNAEALRRHYAPQVQATRSISIGLTISAILSGLLIGAGIILLLAHNWDDLTRPIRAVIAVVPLLVSIALGGYTIWRRPDSAAWREGSGLFYFLSIGSSIALVSQTYHLYNDITGFLLAWLLLALPLIYLLRSGAAFIGFLACLVWYHTALNEFFSWWSNGYFAKVQPLLILLTVMPFYAWQVWKRRESLMVTWLSAALAIAVPLMLLEFYSRSDYSHWHLSFAGLFTLFYLLACRYFPDMRGWRNPFRSVGCLGIATMAIILTFKDPYRDLVEVWRLSAWALGVWLLSAIIWALLVWDTYRRNYAFNWVAILFPGMVAISTLWLGGMVTDASLLMNLYVLVLGVFTLVLGVKRDRLLSMNEGLLLLTALIISRFFDSDYGFVARGVAFIIIGFGFLAMNLWVLMNRKNHKELAV